jgi:ABC-2 type transport system permease protein
VSSSFASQFWELARRSIVRTLRQPAQIVPSLVFPLMLLAVNTGGLRELTKLPKFPTHSYVTFMLATIFVQGATFAMMNAGTDIATDIQTGYFNRLALTPLRGPALIAGQLAGVLVLGVVQAATFLIVGIAAGAGVAAGVGGAAVLLALSLAIVLAFGAIGASAAIRSGSAEAVQGFFPLIFVLLFLSSTNLPRDLMDVDWFQTIATYNPISYLVEGLRSLLVDGWDAEALALAFGFTFLTAVVGIAGANRALRERLARG